tara:strand:- start:2800 stop:3276 length:477 start_codon:yes stop_codon:yes gene_type:complete
MSDPATNLDRLNDLVSPPEISWWPLAPGWYVVAIGVLLFVGILGFRAWKEWKVNAYRRAALRELESASDISTVAEILRRTALMIVPRATVATKAGNAWVDWLESLTSDPMPDDLRHQLTRGIYDRSDGDFNKVSRYASQWIRSHQTELNLSESIPTSS